MSDGLTQSQRQAIISVFSRFPKISEARLYGSRALGRFRDGSDIDLTLIGPIDLATLNRVSLEIDDLLLPYEVDLSLYELIDNSELREHIERVGQVFYRVE